jgi:hypothetical protein
MTTNKTKEFLTNLYNSGNYDEWVDNNYQDYAFKTASNLQSQDKNLMHAMIGALTELGELLDIYKKHIFYGRHLDLAHLGEEIGDVLWYASLWMMVQEIRFRPLENPYLNQKSVINPGQDIYMKIIESINRVSACAIVQEREHGFKHILVLVGALLKQFEKEDRLSISGILMKNLIKLSDRYPNLIFSAEKAINRDLQSEAKILNSGKVIT